MTIPERDIAVIRFSGYAPPEDVDAATSRLQAGLMNEGIVTTGQPFLMRYDSPWTPGFLRRNEVGVVVQPIREGQAIKISWFFNLEIVSHIVCN